MGAYSSQQMGPVLRHWDKELSKLFTSVKITDKFKFPLYYLGFAKNFDVSNEPNDPYYFLLTTDGKAVAILYDEFEEHHSITLHSNNYDRIIQISSSKYVLTYKDGMAEILTNYTDRFEVQTLDISDIAYVSTFDEAFFAIIKNDFSIMLISFDGLTQQPLLSPQIFSKPPKGMLLLSKDLNKFIVYNEDMVLLIENDTSHVQKLEISDSIVSIASCGPNDVYCLSLDKHTMYHISFTESAHKINKVVFANEVIYIYAKNEFFSKTSIRAQKNALPPLVFIQHSNQITAISAKEEIFEVAFPHKNLTTILQLKSLPQNLIIATCSDGSVFLVRFKVEKDSENFRKITETHELENFHHSKILFSATTCELMFITVDDNEKAVIWESLPDWWSVPFYYQMFKGDDEEEDKINAV